MLPQRSGERGTEETEAVRLALIDTPIAPAAPSNRLLLTVRGAQGIGSRHRRSATRILARGVLDRFLLQRPRVAPE